MRLSSYLVAGLAALSANATPTRRQSSAAGSGPYKATYSADPTLPSHTVYLPTTPAPPASAGKLPILIWGNGACAANGAAFAPFLSNIASYGFMVIASGAPGGSGSTTSKMMTDAINWITTNAAASNSKYANVDTTRIASAGQSCGGLEAYDMNADARVSYIGIFNSGLLNNYTAMAGIKKPVFYFIGGSSDIAYANAERDYKALPSGIPSWKGNLPVGHSGTYNQKDGGKFGVAGLNWLMWTLKGNTTASEFFTGKGAEADGWAVEKKDMDKLKVLG